MARPRRHFLPRPHDALLDAANAHRALVHGEPHEAERQPGETEQASDTKRQPRKPQARNQEGRFA